VAVADALRAISAAHREILNETILRGRTVNEAAAAMGLPVGTVKSRVYYALRALRLVLAERAAAEPGCDAPAGRVRPVHARDRRFWTTRPW
jgi:DNA-directed RNA polymerase specialized sigma24 family protein